MKLYEAIETIINEFGKDIIANAKVVNMFSDYNAFEESKTFKIILKNLIAEGYIEQLLYVRDWDKSQDRIINNFIAATSFNEANASYVINSLAYGLGYIKTAPAYKSSIGASQPSTPSKAPKTASRSQQSATTTSQPSIALDKTPSQLEKLGEASMRKYKEAAEAYLESIVEFKSDFEKELGVKIKTYMEFDQFGDILPKFEIDGRIKVKYNYAIMFYVLLYDQNDRMITKSEVYVGTNRKSFEVAQGSIDSSTFHRAGNIKRIVVYWETN